MGWWERDAVQQNRGRRPGYQGDNDGEGFAAAMRVSARTPLPSMTGHSISFILRPDSGKALPRKRHSNCSNTH
jgi:hypothetical protein